MEENKMPQVSATRMRLAVLFLVLWWIPFWAMAPVIAEQFNIKTSVVTFVIMGIQTVIGFLGIWIGGKEVATIIKSTPKKQAPRKVWHVLVHGSF